MDEARRDNADRANHKGMNVHGNQVPGHGGKSDHQSLDHLTVDLGFLRVGR